MIAGFNKFLRIYYGKITELYNFIDKELNWSNYPKPLIFSLSDKNIYLPTLFSYALFVLIKFKKEYFFEKSDVVQSIVPGSEIVLNRCCGYNFILTKKKGYDIIENNSN